MLKRLPGDNKKNENPSNSSNVLNDSCLSLLKRHCGAENSKQRKLRGPKVTPGKRILSLLNKENEAPKLKIAK